MVEINREELAWAAGFFDGEGHTGLIGNARGVQMQMPQIDRRPLDRFRLAVLGLGKVRSTPKRKWKDQWTWHVSNFADTQAVIGLLWRFLSEPKREQAMSVLRAYGAKFHTRGQRCRSGHDDWVLTKTGRRYCDTCYKLTRKDPNGPHRRSRSAISDYKRASGTCRQGHDNWHTTPNGQHYCITCVLERRAIRAR